MKWLKPKYRLVKNNKYWYIYEIQFKYWWMPLWVEITFKSFHNAEDAIAWADEWINYDIFKKIRQQFVITKFEPNKRITIKELN